MSLFRILALAIAVGLMLYFIWFAIDTASTGAMGEVGAILLPFIVLGSTLFAGFFALVSATALYWRRPKLRKVLLRFVLGIVGLAILLISVTWIDTARDNRAYALQRQKQRNMEATREAAIRPVAERYYAQMIGGTLNKGDVMKMRIAFDVEIAALGFKQPDWAVSTAYFQSAQDLYLRLFLNEDGLMGPLLGVYNANACVDIKSDLGDQFGPSQQAVYDEFCPEWVTRYAK